MELSPAPQRCAHCGARITRRASWCSLCLTPAVRTADVPAVTESLGRSPDAGQAPDLGAEATRRRAEAMLLELSVSDRLGGLGDGVTGAVLRLGKLTRFALAFVGAALVVLVAVAATALLGTVTGGG